MELTVRLAKSFVEKKLSRRRKAGRKSIRFVDPWRQHRLDRLEQPGDARAP
jgi:hypothetical protein